MSIVEDGVKRGVRDAVEIGTVTAIFVIIRKFGWTSLFVLLPLFCFIVMAIVMTTKEDKKTTIAKRSMFDLVKIGDSVFVTKSNSLDSTSGVNIYQLYRPQQVADIQKLKLPAWKKKQLADQLDTLQKNSCESVYELKSNEIYQRNTAFIGTVIGKDTTMIADAIGGSYNNLLLEIKPYKKVYDKNTRYSSTGDLYPLKRFYVLASTVDTVNFLKEKKKQ